MDYSKNIVIVTYTHETWGTYHESKFYDMEDAIFFAKTLIHKFEGYSVFSVETANKRQ